MAQADVAVIVVKNSRRSISSPPGSAHLYDACAELIHTLIQGHNKDNLPGSHEGN
jgi:hypothetical protein